MKKLILGLLLTVGVTGVSFAGNENVSSFKNKMLKINILNIDCYHAYYYKTIDCDGYTQSTYLGGNAGECTGESNGSLIMHLKTENICSPEVRWNRFLEYVPFI